MGQWAVCILDKSNVFVGKDSGLEGTFNVFIGKEEAEAYLTAHDEWLAQADDTDSEQQRLHTLLVTTELLPTVRLHLPLAFTRLPCHGVRDRELAGGALQHYKTKVELFQAHGLRQGSRTMNSTGFAVHQDNEIYKFIKYSVVVKLTPDEPNEAPSAMRVVQIRMPKRQTQ